MMKAQLASNTNEHREDCRCLDCLRWWANAGADESGNYGPFSWKEVRDFLATEKKAKKG